MKKKQSSMPEITQAILKDNNEILELTVKKLVTKYGNGAHVYLPGELLGKYVTIIFKKDVSAQKRGNTK